jgi:hypothetical protein
MNPPGLPALPAPVRFRRSARERELRRVRIVAMVRGGFSYAAIAEEEKLSRERVRQIVGESLQEDGGTPIDLALVQMARLEPALRLAADRVAEGDLKAIDRLLKVLDRLDKYVPRVQADIESSMEIHERLMAKMNRALAREDKRVAEEKAVAKDAPAGAGKGASSEAP